MLAAVTLLLLSPVLLGAQALIPTPREVTFGGTDLTLHDTVVVGVDPDTPRTREIAGILADALQDVGTSIRVMAGPAPTGGITLRSTGGLATDESYQLSVGGAGALIEATSEAGLLWGAQTMRQLITPRSVGRRARVQGVVIRDTPRYGWRGTMLDVGRHIFPVAHILKHLEWMSRFKLNVFHWHLTEDQGWRIEIDALPRLTEIGGWRTEDGDRYGGFYSKADIRRVVERARQLGITVVPEIELPGHSRAAIAAYPHLGCTGDSLPVPSTWGVFSDVLCPGKESTFAFIETVLSEVLELFPSRYIHIGGDEVPKDRWRECEPCQDIIRREQLGDEHGLQRWMIARVGRWLAARGRKLIGWDEIMDGGVPQGATVQAWQGGERITAALAAGADVIASPQEWVYLNRQANELTLDRVASFDPAAFVGTGPGRLLGGEAPLWTEHVTSGTNAELMWWPRLMGFAEAMWRGPTDSLSEVRVQAASQRMASAGIAVGRLRPSRSLLSFEFSADSQSPLMVQPRSDLPLMQVRIATGADTGRLQSAHNRFSLDSGEFRLTGEYRGEQIGEPRMVTMDRHLGVGRLRRLATPADARYSGTGPQTLADGARGTTFNDGLWNGWWGPDLDAIFDLEHVRPISGVAVSMLEQVNSWIVYPDTIELHHSLDDTTWYLVQRKAIDRPIAADASSRELFAFDLPEGFRSRWIRVVARGGLRLPDWHAGAGQPAWIFADEIVVR